MIHATPFNGCILRQNHVRASDNVDRTNRSSSRQNVDINTAQDGAQRHTFNNVPETSTSLNAHRVAQDTECPQPLDAANLRIPTSDEDVHFR